MLYPPVHTCTAAHPPARCCAGVQVHSWGFAASPLPPERGRTWKDRRVIGKRVREGK